MRLEDIGSATEPLQEKRYSLLWGIGVLQDGVPTYVQQSRTGFPHSLQPFKDFLQ